MSPADPGPWLLVVAAVHLGFQLTVDLVVYPALGDVPPEQWTAAHDEHSRRIAPVVAALYAPLVLVLGWAATTEPHAPGTWLALGGALVCITVTAAVAVPVHGRLSSVSAAERPGLLRRLDRADRVRTVAAVACVVGALWLASGG